MQAYLFILFDLFSTLIWKIVNLNQYPIQVRKIAMQRDAEVTEQSDLNRNMEKKTWITSKQKTKNEELSQKLESEND